MPNLPRRSVISPFLPSGQMTPARFLASSDSSFFMNLHFGYREQDMKGPEPSRRSRTTSLPLSFGFLPCLPVGRSPQSGHISPVSAGPLSSVPSSISAPSQSGYL